MGSYEMEWNIWSQTIAAVLKYFLRVTEGDLIV